jgi:hypothetical protein
MGSKSVSKIGMVMPAGSDMIGDDDVEEEKRDGNERRGS